MFESFDNYLRSIGYGGIFALAMLTGVCLAAVMIAVIVYWDHLTGGRPMRRITCLFVDCVNGREVNLYEDAFGRRWMAQSAWALFRVSREGERSGG